MGYAFEKLAKVFFENDATQTQQYSEVWHYSDWAKDREEYSTKDIGIDLVAKLKDEDGFCAIQCKFYLSDYSISKADLDSFISASSTSDFKRLVLIDTSSQPISKNAELVFNNLNKDYLRIQLSEIEESRIDWSAYINDGSINLRAKKELKDHQLKAFKEVTEGLKTEDRGKMIMACGTGKTFTSLRIAEELVSEGKMILYMVPSLALMSQTIREWKNDAKIDFLAFSVCSDQKVGKKKSLNDQIQINLNDLAFPATTDANKLSNKIKSANKEKVKVVFSTYQSIDVISNSQINYELDEFDLIICDEAHRTTGATLVGDDESNFVRIHDNENIKGKKRLYMTATPRIYGETAKRREDDGEVILASMDDEKVFGKTLHYKSFGWAVENNLLTDYKVVVLMMDEQIVSDRVQQSFTEGSELDLDDATKMVGCYKALSKIGIDTNNPKDQEDKKAMQKALAFCQNINTSELFASEFSKVVNDYIEKEEFTENKHLNVEIFHVDGTFNAEKRNEKLNWLKEETSEDTCRILSNARCLSEGVDVPSLDAIIFLHPRRSQIDIIQSVGRVMRKSEGKELGYVILPITVAPGVSAEKALNDNERYEVIWQILNALRAHDERFNSTINRIGLGEDVSNRIEIIDGTSQTELQSTTSVVEDVRQRSRREDGANETNEVLDTGNDTVNEPANNNYEQLSFTLADLSQAIKAKIVEKCGTRDYWETWASDIAIIAKKHITRINSIVLNSGTPENLSFKKFVEEIRDDLNPKITESDAIEMLAQHIITRPVFDTLFQGNRFTSENAISKAMEKVLSQIYEKQIDTETKTLKKFYESVVIRAADITTSNGRQQLILELYNRFFQRAFPLMTQKLGIVYTPIEVVDFIINSVENVMQNEFSSSLGEKNVHILEPFVGTGTFISRLLQSGIMSKEQLRRKYKSEIHANEIVLLAYYIACINIEAVYDDLLKEEEYQSFDGIVLTDTFHLYEQERDMIANLLPDNSQRRTNQKSKNINVIIGNPPYSSGQNSANDGAQNISYKNLDESISKTYVKLSKATLKTSLYDSYIRAFRWATDRLGEEGVIGFVTNGGWLDGNSLDGFRKSLSEEFSKIYLFNLRGNARTSGELRRKEKGNVFGSDTRTPIVITILIKNKNHSGNSEIYLHNIGDYLSKEEKLAIVNQYKNIYQMKEKNKFKLIIPDSENDWINQGDKRFNKFTLLGNKKNLNEKAIFEIYSSGVKTNRDAWAYNFNSEKLSENMEKLISNYNNEVGNHLKNPDHIASKDSRYINWDGTLENDYKKNKKAFFDKKQIVHSLYRPFTHSYLYLCRQLNNSVYRIPEIYANGKKKNPTIIVSGVGSKTFSCIMTDLPPCLDAIEKGQCFPLYKKEEEAPGLFKLENESIFNLKNLELLSRDFLDINNPKLIENYFYYIYGVLHSNNYRQTFNNNLSKSLPRIPRCNDKNTFEKFVIAGKKLGDLHMNFNKIKPYNISIKQGDLRLLYIKDEKEFYYVKSMKFAKKGDKSTVIYNKNITITNIPLEAYNYIVNGKSALEWVMERQSVRNDKASGIINDANDYANITMKNPAYPLELFQRVITISLETVQIIKGLPKIDME